MTARPDVRAIREALLAALPSDTSLHGRPPDRSHVYVPPSHVKALHLETPLVIGGRGVGKSFWCAALGSENVREMLSREVRHLANVDVLHGYGERPSTDVYPNLDTFQQLLQAGVEPYLVWRAVVARGLTSVAGSHPIPCDTWENSVKWVRMNPESFARRLEEADRRLEAENRAVLFVFDALDRTSTSWQTMDEIVRDLLRLVLLLKSYQHLHGKVFLRDDQYARRKVVDFPDAAKLTAVRVELTWSLEDLHGLLWQYASNAPGVHGETMRALYERAAARPLSLDGGVWTLDRVVKRHRELQKKLFVELAGPWMGLNRRRGQPYTWIVGHLSDSRGFASPRSVLAAVRAAAEDSLERHEQHDYALHYDSIKRGVQKASEIRVSELAEDYPWIAELMAPLKGMVVPCERDEVLLKWKNRFGDAPPQDLFQDRLPPEHWDTGWSDIADDLVKLGVFKTMRDGRINMPDLYRVGFGLGRRGGVRPVPNAARR